ncbi:hypothetical protein [Cohnella soli]|uniref:Phosphoadenosine phosphosulphate reductase domain-containing protein n=1 Tax=Cohnella soli TaxID=425005 RepID=A0ABW0HQ37_9BACL
MIKHIVCYSGGETSGIVAYEVVKRFGPENVILLNHDISANVEDTDIKRYKIELASALGVPITYANMESWEVMDQFDVCLQAKAFKAGMHPICTSRLKTRPFERWLKENYPADPETGRQEHAIIYYGFEAKEQARIDRRTRIMNEKGYAVEFPVANWAGCIKSTREIGVEPPHTYEVWKHANCIGCLRAGRQHWYVVYCRRPDIWEKAKITEAAIGYSILRIDNEPVFLKEMEDQFRAMKEAGIEATEKVSPTRFWRETKRILKERSA